MNLWIGAIAAVSVACTTPEKPTSTGTVCPTPDPMTFGYTAATTPGCTGTPDQCNFGKTFMDAYCVNCHAKSLPISQRNGAPFLHDFDSLKGVLQVANHIDQQAGFGPNAHNTFMPGAGTDGRCPSVLGGSLDEACPPISDEERTNLAAWIACEIDRDHPNL